MTYSVFCYFLYSKRKEDARNNFYDSFVLSNSRQWFFSARKSTTSSLSLSHPNWLDFGLLRFSFFFTSSKRKEEYARNNFYDSFVFSPRLLFIFILSRRYSRLLTITFIKFWQLRKTTTTPPHHVFRHKREKKKVGGGAWSFFVKKRRGEVVRWWFFVIANLLVYLIRQTTILFRQHFFCTIHLRGLGLGLYRIDSRHGFSFFPSTPSKHLQSF